MESKIRHKRTYLQNTDLHTQRSDWRVPREKWVGDRRAGTLGLEDICCYI